MSLLLERLCSGGPSTYSEMAGLAAVVAAAGGTVNAKRRAISLNVAYTLAVVALLG